MQLVHRPRTGILQERGLEQQCNSNQSPNCLGIMEIMSDPLKRAKEHVQLLLLGPKAKERLKMWSLFYTHLILVRMKVPCAVSRTTRRAGCTC